MVSVVGGVGGVVWSVCVVSVVSVVWSVWSVWSMWCGVVRGWSVWSIEPCVAAEMKCVRCNLWLVHLVHHHLADPRVGVWPTKF